MSSDELSDTRIRNFLLCWVMEFGTGYTPYATLYENEWWCGETMSLGRTPELDKYSDVSYGKEQVGISKYTRINQAGLDFIKAGGDAGDEEKHK